MKLVRHHRAFSHTNWALPPQEINRIEQLANSIGTSDQVEILKWLFAEHRPNAFLDSREEDIKAHRIEAAKKVFEEGGVQSLERLAENTNLSGLVGEAVAHLEISQEQKQAILLHFLDRPDGKTTTIARCLVGELFRIEQLEIPAFIQRYAPSLSNDQFAKFALALPPCSMVWDIIEEHGEEAARTYWKSVDLYRGDDIEEARRAIRKLLDHENVGTAIYTISIADCTVPSDLIMETLRRMPEVLERISNPIAANNFDYEVEELFKCLDRNDDVPIEDLVQLEFNYFPLIERRGRGFPAIKTHLKTSPSFFCRPSKNSLSA